MRATLEARLSSLGLSKSGTEAVLKALHPAGEFISPGWPDGSTEYVVRPEYRSTAVLTGPVGASTWDLLLFMPPGNHCGVMWAMGQSPVDFNSTIPPVDALVGFIPIQEAESTVGTNFPVRSVFNPGSVLNIGPVYLRSRPHSFRHIYSGVTVSMSASAVADQGSVFATQVGTTPRRMPTFVDNVTDVNGTYIPRQHYGYNVPFSEGRLVQVSPNPYVGDARAGVYLPLRAVGPVNDFATGDINALVYAGNPVTPYFWAPAIDPGGAIICQQFPCIAANYVDELIPWPIQLLHGKSTYAGQRCFDTGLDSWSCGIVIFRNLAGPTGGFNASLTIKLYQGHEVIPRVDSPDRTFVKEPIPMDAASVAAYYAIARELPDAYPASFNALGALLPAIARVASAIWPVLAPMIPTLASAGYGAVMRPDVSRRSLVKVEAFPGRTRSNSRVVFRPQRDSSSHRGSSKARVRLTKSQRKKRAAAG